MKRKIFLYHLLVFLCGAGGIATYFFYTIKNLPAHAALAGIALLPVGVAYIVGFGMLCLFSLALWLVVAAMKKYLKKKRG